MTWIDIVGYMAIIGMIVGFAMLIVVGFAHGGKYRMSLSDPALQNEITPLGKTVIKIAGGLILVSCICGGILLVLLTI